MFKWYLARVEKETVKSLKCLRSDRGGEFTSNEFEIEVMTEESKDRYLHLEHLHKIELLKEEIDL